MQCGEGADEASCDRGGCGCVGGDGGGGKEKNLILNKANLFSSFSWALIMKSE